MVAKIAVIGAGWWGQGWHIPCLDRNPDAELVAIVDRNQEPVSDMDANLVSLETLRERYNARIYHSLDEMLQQELGEQLDGVIVCTPHATHYQIGKQIYQAAAATQTRRRRRRTKAEEQHKEQQEEPTMIKPLHILMEKPMTTDMDDALALCDLIQTHSDVATCWINHSANFRPQAKVARNLIQPPPSPQQQQDSIGGIGTIRHVTAFMSSPVQWIFSNPDKRTWNTPVGSMLGNGFAWGQSCHLLGWIYFVCGPQRLKPQRVSCIMNHDPATGADMAHSASIHCDNDIVLSVSGTAYLPGSQYTRDKPIGKQVRVQIYGTHGALLYEGDDAHPESGRMEWRKQNGDVEVLCDSFLFENSSQEGHGAESVRDFVQLCCHNNHHNSNDTDGNTNMDGNSTPPPPPPENCADVWVGLRTVQTLEAMYRSHATKSIVEVRHS